MHRDAASAQSEWTELLKKLGSKREAPDCETVPCTKVLQNIVEKKGKVGNYNMVK